MTSGRRCVYIPNPPNAPRLQRITAAPEGHAPAGGLVTGRRSPRVGERARRARARFVSSRFRSGKKSEKSELDPLDAEKSAGYKYNLPPKRWLTKKMEVA